MRTIFTIARNDLFIFFKQPGNWVSVVVIPLLLTLGLGWAFGVGEDSGPEKINADLVIPVETAATQRFVTRLHAVNGSLRLCPMDNDAENACNLEDGQAIPTVDQALLRVQNGRTAALIVLPPDFATEREQAIDNSSPIAYYSLEDPTLPSPILQSAQTVVQELNGTDVAEYAGMALVDLFDELAEQEGQTLFADAAARENFAATYRTALVRRMENQPELVNFTATAPMSEDTTLQGFEQAVPGMGAMFVMFTVLAGMAVLRRERSDWTLQRTAVAPVSRAQILAGKAGAYFVLGMVQFLVIFTVGAAVGIPLGRNAPALLAVMAAFVLCITGLTFALAPHMRTIGQAANLERLISLTLAPLGGAWWPLAIVPPFMRTIGHISPVAWAMDAFQKIIWFNGGLQDILLELGVLLGAAAVLFGIGVAAFRIDV